MPSVTRPQLHHVALTVTDLDASTAWYQRVFDIAPVMEEPHDGGWQRLLADQAMQLVIVLHRHDVNQGEAFSERRTGLDHFGMGVPSRAELVAWQSHLEEMGVARAAAADRPCTQSPIADTPYGSILVFRDPDNIQLEMFSPPNT
jgi:catechol 2,3-dioxygenase-like lactoylglutathione lyase family enzyme